MLSNGFDSGTGLWTELEARWLCSVEGEGGEGGGAGSGAGSGPAAGPGAPPDGPPAESGDPAGGDGGEAGRDEGAAGGNSPTPPPPPAPAPSPPVDWRDRRIAKLTAQLKELQEKGRLPAPQAGDHPAGLTEADVDRLATEKATALATAEAFNSRCNAAAQAGNAAFGPEFGTRVQALQQLIDRNDPTSIQAYNLFLDAAIETGEGPRLLHELGSDLNEAARILGLPPAKMGMELAKRALRPAGTGSAAPKPISPVGGRGRAHDQIDPTDPERADHISTAEWMRRREAQIAARGKAA